MITTNLITTIQNRLASVPPHSGYDLAGLHTAIRYLDQLEVDVLEAITLNPDLDTDEISKYRTKINDGICRLHARIPLIETHKKDTLEFLGFSCRGGRAGTLLS